MIAPCNRQYLGEHMLAAKSYAAQKATAKLVVFKFSRRESGL